MRVCLPWLNLLHNRYPHLETLGGSVSFQSGINIFSLFIYKLHQQLLPLTYLFILVGARTCHHIFSESTTKKKGINHNFLLKAQETERQVGILINQYLIQINIKSTRKLVAYARLNETMQQKKWRDELRCFNAQTISQYINNIIFLILQHIPQYSPSIKKKIFTPSTIPKSPKLSQN